MGKDSQETLVKTGLPGTVCARLVRCGRHNCRCAAGELHGPYHYRYWREAGRLRCQYVPKMDVASVSAACQRRRQEERRQRHLAAVCHDAWCDLTALVKEVERDGQQHHQLDVQ